MTTNLSIKEKNCTFASAEENTALAEAAWEGLACQRSVLLSPEEYDALTRRLEEGPLMIPVLRGQFAKVILFRE